MTGVVYPPTDPDIVAAMCKYLHDEKRIPMTYCEGRQPIPIPCGKFVPVEKMCHVCNTRLSAPIKISNKAVIITMNNILDDVETYFKRCVSCGMCYRYQEIDHCIHNFNDTLLIGLDVCKFLRECLQQHLPIGSIVKVLEAQLKRRINAQNVINAYLHFDALTNHLYHYNCLICGYYPTTLIMDLNRKVSFSCSMSDLELPEVYDRDAADIVDCDSFWEKVELAIVLRGFPNRVVSALQVDTSLLSWSPYIGRMTRKSSLLFNTEHRKIDRSSGELEGDCREITEERLLEVLQNSTVKEVQSFASSLGFKGKGSKLVIIMQVKNAMAKDDSKFKKAFHKMWGSSGGWVSGPCPRGVIYALKFVLRAESPRDYIDLILSMAHQPNIIVSDMANMLVAHGNKRKTAMFSPFNGMIAEPTKVNVQNAIDGILEVSLPWIETRKNPSSKGNKGDLHPVSGSEQHLCLFDRLHERNAKKEVEILRRVTNVKELKGKLNTQKDEQLHAAYNHDTKYLNQMKPVNHIFLFRSNIDIHNEKINQRIQNGLKAAFKHEVKLDDNGQASIDKSKPIRADTFKRRHSAPNWSFGIDDLFADPKMRKPSADDPQESVSPVYDDPHTPEDTPASTSQSKDLYLPSTGTNSQEGIGGSPDQASTSCQHDQDDQKNSAKQNTKTVGTKEDPIDISNVKKGQQSEKDLPWIDALGLIIEDKHLLERGHWLNDRIINAAMKLLRHIRKDTGIGGLEDLVFAQE